MSNLRQRVREVLEKAGPMERRDATLEAILIAIDDPATCAALDGTFTRLDDPRPIQMILHCPACGVQHIDAPDDSEAQITAAERGFDHGGRDWQDFVEANEWTNPPHRSHLCHGCKHIWRPAEVATEGVLTIATRGSKDSPEYRAVVGATS